MNEESPYIKSLPHSVGCEKAVLSVLSQHSEFWHELGDFIPDWYYLPQNRVLHVIMAKQVELVGAVELVGLYQLLLDEGKLEAVGGMAYVTEVYTYQPSPSHFSSHLETLRIKYACRQAIKAATSIDELAYQSPEADELVNLANQAANEIQEIVTGSKPALDTKSIAREWYNNYQKLLSGEKIPMGIQTGVYEIDQKLRGLHLGMMGVISARSSGGKSTLATQIMSNVASSETPCLYMFLEGTKEAAFSRCIIQLSKLDGMAISDPKAYAQLNNRTDVSKEETTAIATAVKKIIAGGFYFVQPPSRKIQTICSTIRAMVRKNGIKVVFMDYVQIVRNAEKGQSKEQEMMGISNSLQELATQLNIFICVLSQENSEGETKHARAIEEDSDWTLSIVQEQDKKSDNYKHHKHILITKDRHNGNAGYKLPLLFDKDKVKFVYGLYDDPKSNKSRPKKDF
jgi:replicative DNA helicase